jgi:transport family protein 27
MSGDAGVGKSALVQMFHSKGTHYPKQYQMTTGCDFVMKEIKLGSGATVELHIYDCAGQVPICLSPDLPAISDACAGAWR